MAPADTSLLRYDSPVAVQTKDRSWEAEGVRYLQRAASTPATRLEVVALQKRLDRALQERQAHETGVCAIREELYSQCFDEVIRQVAEARLQASVSEQRHAERAAGEASKHAEEVAFLENQVHQLQQQLEAFLAPSSSHGGSGSVHSGSATRA
ncbi:hypothetical protein WJX81_001898 [Elliptochloris bilobata]|uniref:Uncharacterized protein n=1 Tax=Elliptochloris bilobata TaxID=381761 RepID=A0AAW1RQ56_9CHLO